MEKVDPMDELLWTDIERRLMELEEDNGDLSILNRALQGQVNDLRTENDSLRDELSEALDSLAQAEDDLRTVYTGDLHYEIEKLLDLLVILDCGPMANALINKIERLRKDKKNG